MFSEKIKDSLTRSALLQNQLSVLSLKKSSELGAKQLNTVKKALQFLVAVTTEFETFTRSLPKTVKEAEDYYSEHKLQTSKAKTKSIFADAKKRSSFNLGIDNRLALLLLLSLSVLALLHSDTLIKTLSFWRGQGLGAEMGVYKYSIDDNRWLGVVNTRKWESLRLQQKITMIDTLLGEIQSEEFDGFDLINDQGNQVATSIYEGEKLVWRLSQSSN